MKDELDEVKPAPYAPELEQAAEIARELDAFYAKKPAIVRRAEARAGAARRRAHERLHEKPAAVISREYWTFIGLILLVTVVVGGVMWLISPSKTIVNPQQLEVEAK